MRNRLAGSAELLLLALALVGRAGAAGLPIESFFKPYDFTQMKLSPNGKHVALLVPHRGTFQLGVLDVARRETHILALKEKRNVAWFDWAGNERLLFGLEQTGLLGGGLYLVNRDGSQPRPLIAPLVVHQSNVVQWLNTSVLSKVADRADEILVQSDEAAVDRTEAKTQSLRLLNVYRLNLTTGERRLEAANPGRVIEWLADHTGAVRAGVELDDRGTRVIYRTAKDAPWTVLAQFGPLENSFSPVAFADDNKTLYVSSNIGRDNKAISRYDPDQRRLKDLVFAPEKVDASGIIWSARKRALAGVSYIDDRPRVHWLDNDYQRLQAAIDGTLTNTVNQLVSFNDDESRAIVLAGSDRLPGRFYLLNTHTLTMEPLGNKAAWIDPADMAEMRPIRYAARDGLTIHGYLTLPKSSEGGNLPLVVYPHGGPWLRDTWEFDPEVQFLANRGYAVLQMNFRGSAGYGLRFYAAGVRQWGRAMQDDITDGVRWAIGQGVADPDRVAILGASYGGYAALMGLILTPELYKCGISYAGVTDVPRHLRASFGRLKTSEAKMMALIGDPKADESFLKEVSPVAQAARIRAPLLLAYGGRDRIVAAEQAEELSAALRHEGKQFKLVVFPEEGHGLSTRKNRIDFFWEVERFLKEHLK